MSIASRNIAAAAAPSPPRGVRAQLVAEESEDLLVLGAPLTVDARDLRPNAFRVRPLLLIFVQLLQVDQRVTIRRIELHHLLEGLERAIDKPAMAKIEAQAQQHIGVLQPGQVRALQ